MKIAPAMLLCGVALILATPVLADRIESKNDSRTANFFAESAPRATFNERFEPKFTFDAHDRTTPIILSAFSSSFYGTQFSANRFSADEARRFNPSEAESRELALVFSRVENGRRDRNEGISNNAIPKIDGPTITTAAVAVPEPGSLPLLVAGLAAIAIWTRRRNLAAPAPRQLR